MRDGAVGDAGGVWEWDPMYEWKTKVATQKVIGLELCYQCERGVRVVSDMILLNAEATEILGFRAFS